MQIENEIFSYNRQVNFALKKIAQQIDEEDFQIILKYINRLENTIYGYTE